MKKIVLFTLVSVSSFASCKKDRTCTCRTPQPGGSTLVVATVYHNARKKDLRELCLGNQTTTTTGSGTPVKGNDTTCELK